MTNKLVQKVLSTGKKIALGASLIVMPSLGFSQIANDGFINLKEAGQSKNISLVKVNGNKYDFKLNKKSNAEFGIEAYPATDQSDIISIAKGNPNYVYSLKKVEDKNKATLTKKGVLGMNGNINVTENSKTGNNMAGTINYTVPEFEKNFKVKSFITSENDTLSFYFPFIADTTKDYQNEIKNGKKLNYLFIPVKGSEVQANEKGNLEIISSQGLYEFVLDTARSKDIKSTIKTDSIMNVKDTAYNVTSTTPKTHFKYFKTRFLKKGLEKNKVPLSKDGNTRSKYGTYKYEYEFPFNNLQEENYVENLRKKLSSSLTWNNRTKPGKTTTKYITESDTTYTTFTDTINSLINLSYPTAEDSVAINKDETKAGQIESLGYVEGVKKSKKKRNFNIDGRIKVGAGITAPQGYVVSINPQLKIADNFYLGVEGSYTNSTRNLEEITQEPGFKQLVSLPAEMYFVNSGAEVKEKTEIQNNFGVALNASYLVSPHFEVTGKVGTIGQKTKNTMQSIGEEYMEINGEKDLESVYNYNETNTSETNNTLFKGSPVYMGVGAEYKCRKLNNLSLAGDMGYITGKNSGLMGSLKVVYNFLERNKK